jgi:hypothetical protein
MKISKLISAMMIAGVMITGVVDAKPGGGGGGHSASSGGGRSFSAPSAPSPSKGSFSAPVAPPAAQKGSFGAPPAAAPRQTTTTTSTTTMTRRTAGGGYAGSPMMYGGMGMGFGYTNGLLTGLIIGNMMHPTNTVVYSGGGYNGNALLYPDGRVVNQQGYQVGTYQNGQFSPVNGGMVAQPAPADAVQYQNSPTQPVVLEKAVPSNWEIAGMIVLGIACVLLFLFIIGVL